MNSKVTFVLVHAAWADGSSWEKVIRELQADGHAVVSAQIPLTSLTEDAKALRRLLARVEGPVLLVGHSYAGAVITMAATGREQVRGLVYVAAMAPDGGETVGELLHREAAHASAPALVPDTNGYFWLPEGAFRNAVAHRLPAEEAEVLQAVQKPIHAACLTEAMSAPAWRSKRSWFLIAEEDRMISPKTQRFMAERAQATVVAAPVDHSPASSAPEVVVKLLREAAKAVQSS